VSIDPETIEGRLATETEERSFILRRAPARRGRCRGTDRSASDAGAAVEVRPAAAAAVAVCSSSGAHMKRCPQGGHHGLRTYNLNQMMPAPIYVVEKL
jgi:hypothetical protein